MDRQQKLKVVIGLHEGEKSSTKLWRFIIGREYSKDEVEAEVSSLFPHIVKIGLGINLYYHDDLAGKVNIESDGDMQAALQCFVEQWENERRKEYLVLHAEDYQPAQLESTSSADVPAQSTRNRKAYNYGAVFKIKTPDHAHVSCR